MNTTHLTLDNFSENVLHETIIRKDDKSSFNVHPTYAL